MSDEDPRGPLIYAAVMQALDQQVALLENIQSRSGTLLSAASIATSFRAALAIRWGEGLSILTGVAVGAFVFVVAAIVSLRSEAGRHPLASSFSDEGWLRSCRTASINVGWTSSPLRSRWERRILRSLPQ